MGWKYEVQSWAAVLNGTEYRWVQHYAGPSLLKAAWAMYGLRRAGHGCVTLTIRG